jgi:ATP-dependent RNA helicase RhlE
MPTTPDAYTHRIGRTGRAEREGRAYTLVGSEDGAMIRAVEARIGESIPRRTLAGFDAGPILAEPNANARGNGRRPQGTGGRPTGRRRRRARTRPATAKR